MVMKKVIVQNSKINGKGTFALRDIRKHEFIDYIKGPIKHKINTTPKDSAANPDWVGFKKNYWVDPLPPFKYINHSCDPNCGLRGTKMVYALKPIGKGEELTFDYSTSEIDLNWQLNHRCNCGAKNCRRIIRSIQSLPADTVKKYMPYIPTAFKAYINK